MRCNLLVSYRSTHGFASLGISLLIRAAYQFDIWLKVHPFIFSYSFSCAGLIKTIRLIVESAVNKIVQILAVELNILYGITYDKELKELVRVV